MYKKILKHVDKELKDLTKNENPRSLLQKPHFIFSAENPVFKDKVKLNMSHEDVVNMLLGKGYDVSEIQGFYGKPEKSIVIHNPHHESVDSLHRLAHKLGQDSSIYSDGYNHEMHFHHGENAGKHYKGQGTNFHKKPPEDFFSTIGDTHFTHNFNMDDLHPGESSTLKNNIQKSSHDDEIPKVLEHWSPEQNLTHIEPEMAGSGVDRTHRGHDLENKLSFFYPHGTKPEQEVGQSAKSKYTVNLGGDYKVYHAGKDPLRIAHQVKAENNGAFNMDSFINKVKEAGYHGMYMVPHPEFPMVTMFHPVEIHKEDIIKSEDIQKMSRPSITFPKFKGVSTRPDQEVQLLENTRQKELFGRKAAQASYPDKEARHTEAKYTSEGGFEFGEPTTKKVSYQKYRDKDAKRISGKFGRNTLGLHVPGEKGGNPKSAALAGKLRSKYEEGDEQHDSKIQDWKAKRSAIISEYNDSYRKWQKKAYELSNNVKNSYIEDEHSKAYKKHLATRPPKPRMPRKPSKKLKSTSELSPEQAQLRGKTVDSTIHHEGLHHTITQIEDKYGPHTASKVKTKLLQQFDPEALNSVGTFISSKLGYKTKSPKFNEEILAHARDILTNPTKRNAYKKHVGEKADQYIKMLKQGHNRAYKVAKDLRPEDVGFVKSEIDLLKNMNPKHSDKIRDIAGQYKQSKGFEVDHNVGDVKVDKDRASKIAQAYHDMPHQPNHPDVQASYGALINETNDQFKHILNTGFKFTPIKPGMEVPYKTSADLHHDIRENNHMYYFPTEHGFGSDPDQPSDHPMLSPTEHQMEGKPMLANDIFRIVHDYFGHAKEGHKFGPTGEEGAWRSHKKMYSPLAQKALTTETRGQNSWVNFGPHGEHNRSNPSQTIYAPQKAGLLPDWAHEHEEPTVSIYSEMQQKNGDNMKKSYKDTIVDLKKSKNVREQKQKVFGGTSQPAARSPMREKHMEHIKDYTQRRYGLDMKPSGGKIDEKTGQRRSAAPEVGVDKPDWRSGQLEAQANPDAMVHEQGHLEIMPKGIGLKQGQQYMDEQYGDVQRKYGYMKQKQSQGEVQPMAVEQKLRRRMGLPANRSSVPVKDPSQPPRRAVDTGDVIGIRVKSGKEKSGKPKYVDLIRQARLLNEENRERVDMVDRGELKYNKEKGWTKPDVSTKEGLRENINSVINTRARALSKDPSRKDAKTLMRSEEMAKSEWKVHHRITSDQEDYEHHSSHADEHSASKVARRLYNNGHASVKVTGPDKKESSKWASSKYAKSEHSGNLLKKKEIFNKIKNVAAGVAAAGSIASAKPAVAHQTDVEFKQKSPIESHERPSAYEKDDILNAIYHVESSGGRNLNHETVKTGLNRGMRSSSAYGLMPITIRETISKHPDLKEQYGQLLNLRGDKFHHEYHKHPDLDHELASRHYDRVSSHFGHDPHKVGYAWLNGITGTKKAMKKGVNLQDHWHVQKILNHLQEK